MPETRNDGYAEARGLGMPDNQRRGHYIPTNARAQNVPVRVNDIGPTMPGGRVQPLPPPRGNANRNEGPRAVGNGPTPM